MQKTCIFRFLLQKMAQIGWSKIGGLTVLIFQDQIQAQESCSWLIHMQPYSTLGYVTIKDFVEMITSLR